MRKSITIGLGLLGTGLVLLAWWITASKSGELYYPPAPDVLGSVWS